MTLKDLLVIGLPILVLIIGAFWATYQFVRPAPPDHLTISTGAPEGSYQRWATRYKDIFERNGIALKSTTSKGAVDNLDRLLDPKQPIDVGCRRHSVWQRDQGFGLARRVISGTALALSH
jgi:hypothetical protein